MLDSTQGPRNHRNGGGSPDELVPQLKRAEQIARWVVRRHHGTVEEAEELCSEVQVKLLAEDCAVLRSFRGRSKLETFLTTVVQNLFKDFRNRRWGKFRPTAEARRLGNDAIRLEEIQWKDGLSLSQACDLLVANFGVSRAEVERIAARLPVRVPRRVQGEEALGDLSDRGPAPDEALLAAERREAFSRAARALHQALDELPDEDRLILKLAFEKDFTVSGVARTLRLDQKKLYRRLDRLKQDLRRRLEREGIRGEDLNSFLGIG